MCVCIIVEYGWVSKVAYIHMWRKSCIYACIRIGWKDAYHRLICLCICVELFAFELAGKQTEPSWFPVHRRLDFAWSFPERLCLNGTSARLSVLQDRQTDKTDSRARQTVVQDRQSCKTDSRARQTVVQDRQSCKTDSHARQTVVQDRQSSQLRHRQLYK